MKVGISRSCFVCLCLAIAAKALQHLSNQSGWDSRTAEKSKRERSSSSEEVGRFGTGVKERISPWEGGIYSCSFKTREEEAETGGTP